MSDSQWRLEVDRHLCISSGMCVGIAPDHFELEGDGSHALADVVDQDEAVVDAAESCPVEAIKVFSAASNELVAPTD
ncbi:ferredoxin [Kibdelosporangium persicum]|uniref:Ferredoxin n=1 Tax=Kibdelosporangium persicum TaxID=2698649 RepID=A0ABX2F7F2_9PSEU|nr:ferredoxin [Kibdelosporangium persicum]NRN66748.1 Ferredoxin I [Kibdelosporangium persicum]